MSVEHVILFETQDTSKITTPQRCVYHNLCMSQNKSVSEIAILPCLASFETPGYDADISSIGIHSMDTVSTSQGGYSADGEDKGPISRVNPSKHARQVSSQTIFASDDEEDVNWSLILAHIDGQQSAQHDLASQSTVLLKHEETMIADMLYSQNSTQDHNNIRGQQSETQDYTRTLLESETPLSNRQVDNREDDTTAIAKPDIIPEDLYTKAHHKEDNEQLAETQVYSVHDPLEEHEDLNDELHASESGLLETGDQREDEIRKIDSQHSDDYPETQVYDVYEPLTQNEEDFPDVIVKSSMDHTAPLTDNIASTVRQHSTLSMTGTLEGMHFADSEANQIQADIVGSDKIKPSKEANNSYILYKDTQNLINSQHPSQQLPDDVNYVETSDSEEMIDSAASFVDSQHSINDDDNPPDILGTAALMQKSQAVIQSTFPSSMDEIEDELTRRRRNSDDHGQIGTPETMQNPQQSSLSSSQQSRLAFDKIVKKPIDNRKRSGTKLDDSITSRATTSKRDNTDGQPPVPKRRPVLGLAKPTATSTVRAVKSNATQSSPKPLTKAIRRSYGVNHRRKLAR